nr:MAG TPA: hypothetical protein [Caudoviricetes sp.]
MYFFRLCFYGIIRIQIHFSLLTAQITYHILSIHHLLNVVSSYNSTSNNVKRQWKYMEGVAL